MPTAVEHAGGGPVYFSWANADETTFDDSSDGHVRYDEYILSLEIDLEEGKIPVATLQMVNPGASSWWLKPGQKRWAWIAFDDDSNVVPKFFGRILALPSDMNGEIVTVKFYAKPLDYAARKEAAAAALRVLPNWDKVFVDPSYVDDPDTVLEGYSRNWHHDPVTHAITTTDYIFGEDGEEEFFASEIVYDSLTFVLGDPPPRAVKVDAVVSYTQKASGTVDIGANEFTSYTGQGLFQGWPKPGASVGAGWSVADATALDVNGCENAYVKEFRFEYKNGSKEHSNGDVMSVNETMSKPMCGDHAEIDITGSTNATFGDPETGRAAALSTQEGATWVLQWKIRTTLALQYEAERERTEHLSFTLALESQAILSDDDGSDDLETLTLTGADVGQPLPGEVTPPIGDVSRRSYFPTNRGLSSTAYVINVARAHLLSQARPAEISFSPTSFSRALYVSCRNNARVHDARRLPNGEASGKVVNVKLTADGDSGQFLGLITAKGAIGRGGTVVAVAGTPTITDADVLGPDVQLFTGRALVLAGNDCGYSLPVDGVNDDGLVFPLTRNQVVVRSETLTSPGDTQEEVLSRISGISQDPFKLPPYSALDYADQAAASANTAQKALEDAKIWYELELKPVADLSFEYSFDITAGPLVVAAQVDLES